MGKKKDQETAIREKAVRRFFALRDKVNAIRSTAKAADEDRVAANSMLNKFKSDLDYLEKCPIPAGRTKEESANFYERRKGEISEAQGKVKLYQDRKDSAESRYWECVNFSNSFGNIINDARKAIVELGFLSEMEAR